MNMNIEVNQLNKFRYMEFYNLGQQNRNELREINPDKELPIQLEDLFNGTLTKRMDADFLRSLTLYDDSVLEFIEKKGSIAGFSGKQLLYNIYIDFDSPDEESLSDVKNEVIKFINKLEKEFSLTPNEYDLYWSGSRGFVMEIPMNKFIDQQIPLENTHDLHKYIVEKLTSGINFVDFSIYSKNHLGRTPYSRNTKKNLFRNLLSYDSIRSLDVNQIMNSATSSNWTTYSSNNCGVKTVGANPKLESLYKEAINKISKTEQPQIQYSDNENDSVEPSDELLELISSFLQGSVESYKEWINEIGLPLASLGERGRKHFIKISTSQRYPDDDYNSLNKQFDKLLKYYKENLLNKVTFRTLFNNANSKGFKQKYSYRQPKNSSEIQNNFNKEIKFENSKERKIKKNKEQNKEGNFNDYEIIDTIDSNDDQKLLEYFPKIDDSKNDILFDITKLNDSLFKKLLIEYDKITTTSSEFLLGGLLATLSGTIGKTIWMYTAQRRLTYPNLWILLLGPSSISQKSTAISMVSDVIKDMSIELDKKYKDQLVEYRKAKEKDKDIQKPNKEHLVLPTDSTSESLFEILANNTRGVVIQSEFTTTMSQMERNYSQDLKQFFLDIYDVPKRLERTRKSSESIVLERPFMSYLGGSTIELLKKYISLDDFSDGYMARINSIIRHDTGKPISTIADYIRKRNKDYTSIDKEIFQTLYNLESREITVNDTALELLDEMERKKKNFIKYLLDNGERAVYDRTLINTYKIAMIICRADEREIITINDVQDAVKIAEFFDDNTRLLFTKYFNDSEIRKIATNILNYIVEKKETNHSSVISDLNLSEKRILYEKAIVYLIKTRKIIMIKGRHKYNKKISTYYRIINL